MKRMFSDLFKDKIKPSKGTNVVRGEFASTKTMAEPRQHIGFWQNLSGFGQYGFRCKNERCHLLRGAVGFTLAEVLITLGIIGIVAALTIPTLIKNYKKTETISKLKKVYSEMNQAILLSEIDNGKFDRWGITTSSDPAEYVKKFWQPYFKGAKYCETFSDCGYSKTRPWTKQDGSVSAEDVTGTVYRRALMLADGTVVSFRIPPVNQVNTDAKINIDINGAKGPNISGIDYFWLIPSTNGRGVIPYGYGLTDEQLSTRCNTNGDYCFAKIIADGWEMKEDYPWK